MQASCNDERQPIGPDDKHWHVIRSAVLGGPPEPIWELIGGFYNIHLWHPDITETEVPPDQTRHSALRRILTFPGQPKTVEQLVSVDNADFHYRYKWHAGQWGEEVKNYHASLRVLAGDLGRTSIVQWESTFDHPSDAISDFYLHGFAALEKRFPLPA